MDLFEELKNEPINGMVGIDLSTAVLASGVMALSGAGSCLDVASVIV